MIRYYFYFLGIILVLGTFFTFSACTDTCEQTFVYTVYEPVYMSKTDFVAAVRVVAPQPVQHPGKIYIKDTYLFINEQNKGIHIIDNQNPEAPKPLSFIQIPGSVDMAVKDQILYADSKMDFLAIDISDPKQPQIIKRISDVFRNTQTFPGNWWVWSTIPPELDTKNNIILDWVKKEETRVEECADLQTGWFRRGEVWFFATMNSQAAAMPPPSSSSGIGGSMARFCIVNKMLYAVDNAQLRLFDVSQAADPVFKKEEWIGSNIETIFPYQNNLFFGTRGGMLIYNIANPEQPAYVSQLTHFFGCDPVVVQDTYAYVTVKGGTSCRSEWDSELQIVDISTITQPKTVRTYKMEDPNGVGIDGSTLFVCDGTAGLKVFDATDKMKVTDHLLKKVNTHAYDIIPYQNKAIVIGNDGLYQYDYSDVHAIRLLSVIPIQKEQ